MISDVNHLVCIYFFLEGFFNFFIDYSLILIKQYHFSYWIKVFLKVVIENTSR